MLLTARQQEVGERELAEWQASKYQPESYRRVRFSKIRERRPMPSEVLQSKGFPIATPVASDAIGFRFAGNAVPINWFTVLLSEEKLHLEEAGVCKAMVPKKNQYVTWLEQPLHTHDQDLAAAKYEGGKAKTGHTLVHNLNRKKVSPIPVSVKEWEIISEQGVYFKDGRYANTSKVHINMA